MILTRRALRNEVSVLEARAKVDDRWIASLTDEIRRLEAVLAERNQRILELEVKAAM